MLVLQLVLMCAFAPPAGLMAAENPPAGGAVAVQAAGAEPEETDAERFGASMTQMGQSLTTRMGNWVNTPVVLGITWLQLILAGLVLVVVGFADGLLRFLFARQIRREHERAEETKDEKEKEMRTWFEAILRAAVPPLALFIWVFGLYAIFAILLSSANGRSAPSLLFVVLEWLHSAGGIVALFWFLYRMIQVVEVRLKKWASGTDNRWDDVFAALFIKALRLIVPILGVILALPTLDLPEGAQEVLKHISGLLLIGVVGFFLLQMVNTVEEALLRQYQIDVRDNLEARKVYTQVKVLKKLAVTAIIIFTAASMLMVFDSVRQLGTSILASAGIAGIIVGFAAQRSIATFLAGLQIAITQPIRIDDVVIVENEWGRIEEITLTYVVVRIWDMRRLIVPINYFIERPFQNWTRVSADLLGSVFFHVDYSVPLQAMREELDRILENSKHWDRKVKVLQVTDSKERTLEVRILASAADGPSAWDLRCDIRERMIVFLQKNHPGGLPKVRAEVAGSGIAGNSEASRPGIAPAVRTDRE